MNISGDRPDAIGGSAPPLPGFFLLNEAAPVPAAGPVSLSIVNDGTAGNDLKLVLVNASGSDRTLTGGTPMDVGQGTASTVYFTLPNQSFAENNAVALAAESRALWNIKGFDRHIAVCPKADLVLPAGTPVLVHLTQVADARAQGSGGLSHLLAQNCPAALGWSSATEAVSFPGTATAPMPADTYQLNSDLPGGGAQINITALTDANLLTLTLSNTTGSPICPRPSGGFSPNTMFVVDFAYGDQAIDFAPLDLVAGIQIAPVKPGWTVNAPADPSFPLWELIPDPNSDAVLDVGEEVHFVITRIVTEPNAQAGDIAMMTVTNQDLPDYRKTTITLPVTKGYFPKIVHFTFQSHYDPASEVDAATGASAFNCYAGDTVTIGWETCGSDPAHPDQACTFTCESAGTVQHKASYSADFLIDQSAISAPCTLVCNGPDTESAVSKVVVIKVTPPQIVGFKGFAVTPVLRLSWGIVGVTANLTLEGPGIAGQVNVTGLTAYIPQTTGVGDTYTYILTCKDGVNRPVTSYAAGGVWQPPADLSAVFTPVNGGISMWVPGHDPVMIAPTNLSATITDINIGADWQRGGNIQIFWVDAARAVLGSWTYPNPYSVKVAPAAGEMSELKLFAPAGAPNLTFYSVASDLSLLGRDADTNALYASSDTIPSCAMLPVLDTNNEPLTSSLGPPRMRYSMALLGNAIISTGTCVFGANMFNAGPSFTGEVYIPSTDSGGMPPPDPSINMAEFTVHRGWGYFYWTDPGRKALRVVRNNGAWDPPFDPPVTLCSASPCPGSLAADFSSGQGGQSPTTAFVYWLESSTIAGTCLLYRTPCLPYPTEDNLLPQEVAAVAATPGHFGLAVLTTPRD